MFALEITFQDGVSDTEVVFVRRPLALIGATETAHVTLEDMKRLPYALRLTRDSGRKFRIKPVPAGDGAEIPGFLEGVYDGEASIDLGVLKFHITALDIDTALKETEPPDRAGARILRQACTSKGPLFPAMVVNGNPPIVMSFVPDQPLYIGRSNSCALRLDSPDISGRHARVGYESGEFWVEDLGSTNGTFVNQQQISGRVNVPSNVPVVLARDISIIGVTSELELSRATEQKASMTRVDQGAKYPALVSLSSTARPARVVVMPGTSVTLGRDPSCDMWLGAPHVSRRHCEVAMTRSGTLTVIDHSTNGTVHDSGQLQRGDTFDLQGKSKVLELGGGITVSICFSEGDEQLFSSNSGALDTFSRLEQASTNQSGEGRRRRTTTWFKPGSFPRFDQHSGKASTIQQFKAFLGDLTLTGRLVMSFVVVAVLGFVVFVGALLIPLLR